MLKTRTKILLGLPFAAGLLFAGATLLSLKPVGHSFATITADSRSVPLTDRGGQPLSITYQTRWNSADAHPLYDMPPLLKDAFLHSEDRKFWDHGGVDWKGRAAALIQNARKGETVRGASTITEQVVRMINPRPRNLWSKWLEGIEATLLERRASKAAILEFYLNQVPYAANRRGVVQAARYYFNRDLETLSDRETLSLVVLARAPSYYDLYKNADRLEKPLARLTAQLEDASILTPAQVGLITEEELTTATPSLPVDARHFARYVLLQNTASTVRTTLDASLQSQVQDIIDARLKRLSGKHVTNAGAIVIDHETNDILAWVVGGANDPKKKGGDIDTITAPRQPGSTLKPFLYAMALEKGWTAATILKDAPIAEAVGTGLHRFRNYSNTYYGPLTLRESLGNSLNIPAVLTINYVGVDPFLSRLHQLGFNSLDRGAQIYDEGLALGNGEVTLLELARAYTVLARRGDYRDLTFVMDRMNQIREEKIYSPEISSLVTDILSDPSARSIEFGRNSILNLPVRTAAKTGTSTDYRDAWAVGYNDRYTIAIWMGNLDRTPMKDVTGSTGPALALRSVFNILNKGRDSKGLYLSPALVSRDVCTRPAKADSECPSRNEWFIAGTETNAAQPFLEKNVRKMELVRPTEGLRMAYDPRIPKDHQKFRFELSGLAEGDEAQWVLNGQVLGRSASGTWLWPVAKGTYTLAVTIHDPSGAPRALPPVRFFVR